MSINIVLVACYGAMQPPNAEPLAIESLAGALSSKFSDKVNVIQQTLNVIEDVLGNELITKISKIQSIDILGVSIPQSCSNACNFIKRFSEERQDTLIVLGHALPTHNPDFFLREFPNALIVRGWGEDAICQIAEERMQGKNNWAQIPNLVFLNGKEIVKTHIEWPIPQVSPIRSHQSKYFPRIESSRGCHYDICTFCTRPIRSKGGAKWIRLPIEKTLSEIKDLIRNSRGRELNFTFTDEDFIGDDLEGADVLADKMSKLHNIRFSISIRVDNVYNPNGTAEENELRLSVFRKLKQSGLSLVYFGAESFSETQLRRYGKGIRVAESVQSITLILNLGVQVELGYILFDPLLSVDELIENVEWLDKTSLWLYVGQLFNNLRVQKDSGFEIILRNKNLIKENLRINTMEFDYSFANPIIGKIAQHCLTWKEEIDEVYSLARNVQRTSFKDSSSAVFVNRYRDLEFLMLKSISTNLKIDKSKFRGAPEFNKQRVDLVSNLHKELTTQRTISDTEKALLIAAQKFLDNANRSPNTLFDP
jgi:hypothetical protein